jgi:hypothetical protein
MADSSCPSVSIDGASLANFFIDGYAHVRGRNDGIGKRDKHETRADQTHLHRDEYRL